MLRKNVKPAKLLMVLPIILAATTNAMADPTAGPSGELTVTGAYTPGACSAVLANHGTIDYGHIQSSSLSNEKPTNLAVKTLTNAITVNCPVATSVGLTWVDNRKSSAIVSSQTDIGDRYRALPSGEWSAGYLAGLGVDSSQNKIGNYVGELDNLKIDGVSSLFSAVYNYPFVGGGGSTAEYQISDNVPPGGIIINILDANDNVAVGKVFTMDYSVMAQVAPSNSLNLSKEISLDGSMTISLYYL